MSWEQDYAEAMLALPNQKKWLRKRLGLKGPIIVADPIADRDFNVDLITDYGGISNRVRWFEPWFENKFKNPFYLFWKQVTYRCSRPYTGNPTQEEKMYDGTSRSILDLYSWAHKETREIILVALVDLEQFRRWRHIIRKTNAVPNKQFGDREPDARFHGYSLEDMARRGCVLDFHCADWAKWGSKYLPGARRKQIYWEIKNYAAEALQRKHDEHEARGERYFIRTPDQAARSKA